MVGVLSLSGEGIKLRSCILEVYPLASDRPLEPADEHDAGTQ